MKRHINIPIFIPHLGCPNMCVFCNQRTISGVNAFDISSVKKTIDDHLSLINSDDEVEIAFFGGSFTGIDRKLMISLLEIAHEYLEYGKIDWIRCSTRPDYIDHDILRILKNYGVKTIELGLQSTDENVLSLTKRGHSFFDEANACRLIIEEGFDLVGQMMIGLPASTLESELKTADFIINSGAIGARIYPTVVFHDTELCEMTEKGLYNPLTLDDAIERSCVVLEKFIESKIDVIRIGLCSSDNLLSPKTYFAGPNHPALGELVESELYYKKIFKKVSETKVSKNDLLHIFVAPGALSKAIGHKQKNKLRLKDNFEIKRVTFAEKADVPIYDVCVAVENGDKKCI